LLVLLPQADAATAKPEQVLPKGVKLPAGVAVPNDTVLAIYFPPTELKSRTYLASLNTWIDPGKALDESRSTVAKKLFPNAPRTRSGASMRACCGWR